MRKTIIMGLLLSLIGTSNFTLSQPASGHKELMTASVTKDTSSIHTGMYSEVLLSWLIHITILRNSHFISKILAA